MSKGININIHAPVYIVVFLISPFSFGNELNVENNMSSWYAGIRIGKSLYQDACGESAFQCENNTLSKGFYLGYWLNNWLSLETGVNDYGAAYANYNNGEVRASVLSGELSIKVQAPLSSNWSLYGRGGASYQHIDKESTLLGASKSNNLSPLVALGMSYDISPRWTVGGEYVFINGIGNNDVLQADLYSAFIGLTYKFGYSSLLGVDKYLTELPKSSKKVITQDVTTQILKSSIIFDFDSSDIKNELKIKGLVDEAVKRLIVNSSIVGYTDSMGTQEYNQNLSERRAQAVAKYLRQSGIRVDSSNVKGAGESNPIAPNDSEVGRMMNRRVEVEIELENEQPTKGVEED